MSRFWGNHVIFERADFEAMFSEEHGLHNYPSFSEELSPESSEKLDQIKEVLNFIPPREADFLELYFFQKVTQTGISQLFGVSQPTVCYRLQKATKRLQYLLGLPTYQLDEIEKDVRGVLTNELDVQIMVLMLKKTCQSEVARELGVGQGLVRHRFLKYLKLFQKIPNMEKSFEVFTYVAENFNILKDTNRTSWEDPITYSL